MSGQESGRVCFSPVLEISEQSVNEKSENIRGGATGAAGDGGTVRLPKEFLPVSLGLLAD